MALYQQVSDDILRQVQIGAIKVGDRLPPEADYAANLGISRSTLRLAYAELERVGVLQRKKRAGTTIIADQPKPQFNMNTTGLHELLSLTRDTDLTITNKQTVQATDIPHLQGHENEADQFLEIAGTRTLPNEADPFNITRIYVPARYAAIMPVLKATESSVFRVIEDTYDVKVARIVQAAKAIACPAEAARIIGISTGAPALQILAALYLGDGSLMEVSVATFDPDRFQLRTDVKVD